MQGCLQCGGKAAARTISAPTHAEFALGPPAPVPAPAPLQVARLAHDKHGGAEGLIQHQQSKLDARMQTKLRVGAGCCCLALLGA
jgi:hypothetical protein